MNNKRGINSSCFSSRMKKRGISGIVMAVIMIALVLIAAGIFWVVIGNLLDKKADDIAAADKCLGIDLKPTNMVCVGTGPYDCTVNLERGGLSTSENIGGVSLTFSNGTSSNETSKDGNIVANTAILVEDVQTSTGVDFKPNNVVVKIYMGTGNDKVYCTQINQYTVV